MPLMPLCQTAVLSIVLGLSEGPVIRKDFLCKEKLACNQCVLELGGVPMQRKVMHNRIPQQIESNSVSFLSYY